MLVIKQLMVAIDFHGIVINMQGNGYRQQYCQKDSDKKTD